MCTPAPRTCPPTLPAELHVLDGVPSFIFVQAKYTIEVGGSGGVVSGWSQGWNEGGQGCPAGNSAPAGASAACSFVP